MAEIVISEFMDEASVAALTERYAVLYDPGLVDDPPALMAAVADARALIVRNRTQVLGPLLEAAPALRVIGRLGIGLDNIDLAACRARGIAVCPAHGANAQAVAEYVIAVTLLLLRGAYGSSAALRAGAWPRTALIGREIAGKRLGLVGLGVIARALASRAQALGMSVVAFDPLLPAEDPAWASIDRLSLPALLAESDVVSLHVPLNDNTRHLLDVDAIDAMKPGALLINTARGGIVDEVAMVAALREGKLAGAALDVFEKEPLDTQAGSKFAGLENLVLTPHIAGLTEESNRRVGEITVANVCQVLEETA